MHLSTVSFHNFCVTTASQVPRQGKKASIGATAKQGEKKTKPTL